MKRVFFLLCFIFLMPAAFLMTLPETYDLLGHARAAKWRNDRGRVLPFPGSTNDPRGFVRFSPMRLEDGSTSSGILETHPRWDRGGWIEGEFSVTVPAGSVFEAEVGFLEGASGTDGVVFEVFWRKGGTEAILARLEKGYSGRLESIRADLAAYAGRSGRIVLRVGAGVSSGKDWAAWKKAAIIPAPPSVSIQQATPPAQAKAQAPKPQREHPAGKAIPRVTIHDGQEFSAHPNWDVETVKFLFEKDKDRLGVRMEFFGGPPSSRFYLFFNTNKDETADLSLICQPDKFEVIRGADVIPPLDVIYSGTPVVSDRTYSLDFPWHHLMALVDKAYVWALVPDSGDHVPDEGYRAELAYDRSKVEVYPDQDRDYISDDVEYRLLQKFSPYYKFARKDGKEESYRPSDPVWQLQFAQLKNDDWLDGSPPDNVRSCPDPISPPERLLDCLGGRTDLTVNPTKTRYFINIGDDRGRPGPPWSDILAEGHTGTFGHVVPAEMGFCKDDRASQVLGPQVREYYKVEYWQYFGYNGVDTYCCDHEGDWCTVQLWVDPETEKPVLTAHFTHGKVYSMTCGGQGMWWQLMNISRNTGGLTLVVISAFPCSEGRGIGLTARTITFSFTTRRTSSSIGSETATNAGRAGAVI